MSVNRAREIEEWRARRRAEKRQENWVIVIVVLAIASSVLIVPFLYLHFGGDCCSTTTAEPNIQFSDVSGPGTIIVAGVSEKSELGNFKAVLLQNGVQDGDYMDPLREVTVDQITFTDLDGDGKLSLGDYFTLSTIPNNRYKLSVIWKESGNERGSQEWET